MNIYFKSLPIGISNMNYNSAICFLQTHSFDVFIHGLDSHSDGTHSLTYSHYY